MRRMTGKPKDPHRIAKGQVALEAILFRHRAIVERDHAALNDSQRDLVLDFFCGETWGGFVLDDETFDLIVIDIAGADNRQVAPGRISWPPLLTI
jgi:hypothetical protein